MFTEFPSIAQAELLPIMQDHIRQPHQARSTLSLVSVGAWIETHTAGLVAQLGSAAGF